MCQKCYRVSVLKLLKKQSYENIFGVNIEKNCVKYGTGEEVELFLPSCQLYDYILP